jgi:hypothetical protein
VVALTLSKEDIQEIVALLDDIDATELQLRTRHYTLSLRRDRHRVQPQIPR